MKINVFIQWIKITEKTKTLRQLKIKNTSIIVICEDEIPSVVIYEKPEEIISIIFSKMQEIYSFLAI